jgi:hypothetical protein
MNDERLQSEWMFRNGENDLKEMGQNNRHVFSLTRGLSPLDLLLALVIVGARDLLRAVPVRLVGPVVVNVARRGPRPRRSAVR